MYTETEDYVDEEYASEPEHIEHEPRQEENREFEGTSEDEGILEAKELDHGTHAVLEHKGGEADDWELAYWGDSGYRFDGECIRDPDGNVWMNEDRELHEEMLAQWKEGGEVVFFLPDYRESEDDVEVLYVTQLILGADGRVTYEIHKHEMYRADDEMNLRVEDVEAYAKPLHAEYETDEYSDTGSREEEISMDALEAHAYVEIATAENFNAPMHAVAHEAVIETSERASDITQEAGSDEHAAREAGVNEHGDREQPDAWLVELLTVPHAQREQHADARTNTDEHVQETAQQRIEAMHEWAENETGSELVIPHNLESLEPAENAAGRHGVIERMHAPIAIETHMISTSAHVENVVPRMQKNQTSERETREAPYARTETHSEAQEPMTLLRTEWNQTKTVSIETKSQERAGREQTQSVDANFLPDALGREQALETAPAPLSESHGEHSERAQRETILRALGMPVRKAYDAERVYATPGTGRGIATFHDDHAETKRSNKDREHRLSMDGISMEIEIAA